MNKAVRKPRKSVSLGEWKGSRPLRIVYSDVVGPMKHKSIGNSKYFVTLMDEYSGYSIVRLINMGKKIWFTNLIRAFMV